MSSFRGKKKNNKRKGSSPLILTSLLSLDFGVQGMNRADDNGRSRVQSRILFYFLNFP
jgi:hypothetical protein